MNPKHVSPESSDAQLSDIVRMKTTARRTTVVLTPERLDWWRDRIAVEGLNGVFAVVVEREVLAEMAADGLLLPDVDHEKSGPLQDM